MKAGTTRRSTTPPGPLLATRLIQPPDGQAATTAKHSSKSATAVSESVIDLSATKGAVTACR
jgi:hypothetical protein